jgi:hypothetical protein
MISSLFLYLKMELLPIYGVRGGMELLLLLLKR